MSLNYSYTTRIIDRCPNKTMDDLLKIASICGEEEIILFKEEIIDKETKLSKDTRNYLTILLLDYSKYDAFHFLP